MIRPAVALIVHRSNFSMMAKYHLIKGTCNAHNYLRCNPTIQALTSNTDKFHAFIAKRCHFIANIISGAMQRRTPKPYIGVIRYHCHKSRR